MAKVRHGLVRLSLDVPDDDFLPGWGTTAYQPLAGHVTFFETDRRTARETLLWEAGHCVSYVEDMVSYMKACSHKPANCQAPTPSAPA